MTKETDFQVDCPISRREETVYVRSTLWEDVFLAAFNGCDNQFSACVECEQCRKETQKRFTALHPDKPPILWNTP